MLKINYAWIGVLLAVVVMGLIFIIPTASVGYPITCDGKECLKNASENRSLYSQNANVTIVKISSDNDKIVNKLEDFNFYIGVYNYGLDGATVNVTDVLPSCFMYRNSSLEYYNASGYEVSPVPCGNSSNNCDFTATSLDGGGTLLKWHNLHLEQAYNDSSMSKPLFIITIKVTSEDCYGNYTNYANYTGIDDRGYGLDEVDELCQGNYMETCNTWESEGFSNYNACIDYCSAEWDNVNNLINEANASIFINGTPHINLPIYKYAPENSTIGENFTYNITFTVLHPYGNNSNITLIDNLPPQVSLISCNDSNCECNQGASIFNCTYNDLPNGTTKSIEVLVHVDEDAFGSATNYAYIQAFSIINSTCNMTANNDTTNTTRILSGYISGVVFNDTDRDGFYNQSEGDIPFSNYPVNITDGVRMWSVNTSSDGTYSVLVPFGNYNITTLQPANMKNTTPLIYMVDVNESKNYGGNDFGFKDNYGYISGIVFNDTDGSGDYNSTYDSPIANYPINITNGTHTWTVNTSPNGTYSIFVPFGTYNVTTVQPDDMQYTTASLYNVLVNETRDYTGNDFGFGNGLCPYEINPSCYPDANITVLINGVETYTFGQSGRPYNVTVVAKDRFGVPISNLTVRIVEKNGHNPFALTQYSESNVTNYLIGETRTDDEGKVSFTLVPTGGILNIEDNIGSYNITAYTSALCGLISIKNYNVANRHLPYPEKVLNTSVIPNYNDVILSKEKIYDVYARIRGWLDRGGGENHGITIYTNGTAVGMPIDVISGKLTGLHINVLNPNGTPVDGAKVVVTEKNGHNPFALTQYTQSNLTNYMVGETYTDAKGEVNFTIVPTGGILGLDDNIGNYSVVLEVRLNNSPPCDYSNVVYMGNINVVNRDLPYPFGFGFEVPNQDPDIINSKERIFDIYTRIRGWLTG